MKRSVGSRNGVPQAPEGSSADLIWTRRKPKESGVKPLRMARGFCFWGVALGNIRKALEAFSVIQADFLMKNEMNGTRIFTFLSKSPDGSYFCRSFFPDNKKDYSERQTNWTVLFKKKRYKVADTEEVLFQHRQYANHTEK